MKRNQFASVRIKRGALIVLFALCMVLTGCGAQKTEVKPTEGTQVATQPKAEVTTALTEAPTPIPTESPYALIEMPNLVLQFPKELIEYIVHERAVYGAATTEAFYLKNGEVEIPLFRVDVGNQDLGDWLGMLKTENGDIPVSYTVFEISEEDRASLSEEAAVIYADLMDGFNVMLDGIFSDPRYTAEKPLEIGDSKATTMAYWTVELTDNMTVVESADNGYYQAIFYGQVQGENVALYTVHIGDDKAESELGLYEVDGVKKPISVGSFDLSEKPNWTEDDYSTAYRMMDTINYVIDTIMNSEQFSIPVEEPVVPNAAQ